MARETSDREDLLREATALVQRVEFQLVGDAEPVVVGFRRDGGASLFFGAQFVLQFNARNELRRSYRDGKLLKAQHGQLVELRREATTDSVLLVSRTLTADESTAFVVAASDRLRSLATAIGNGQAQVLRQYPPEADVRERVAGWLSELPAELVIAARPNAG